jgi:serine protease Do
MPKQTAMIAVAVFVLAGWLLPVRTAMADSANIGYLLAPRAFRAAAEKVKPYMVTIDTVGGLAMRPPRDKRKRVGGLANPGEGPTTGLILTSDGHIITSTFNFIRKPRIITVELPDGTQKVAKLLGRDDTRKLTLLKVEGVKDLPVPTFVDPAKVSIGQWAISVGVGYGGDQAAVSAGIISAKNRVGGRALQTDANLSPANYGGPLIDIDGNILGICVPMNPRAKGGGAGAGSEWYDSGIGFAVTMFNTQRLIDRMKKGEHLKRGMMGFLPSPKTLDNGGIEITRVLPGSPSEKAGLEKGDVIVAIDGKVIDSIADLRQALGQYVAGETVKVTYRRGEGDAMDADVTLATGPFKAKPQPKPDEKPEPEGDETRRSGCGRRRGPRR